MSTGYISGIGTLVDCIVLIIASMRLKQPASEEGYNVTTFRGSFFWFFALMVPFTFFMSSTLVFTNPVSAGYGYTIGHIFLYLAIAAYLFAPFSILTPDSKVIPYILSALVVISGIIITIINWTAYSNGSSVPKYDNGVALYRPPLIVANYIAAAAGIAFLGFGFAFFLYHALRTKNAFLKKRSIRIAVGFLVMGIGGPLHDQTWPSNIAPYLIGFADFITAVGFIIIATGLLLKQQSTN